MDIDWLELLKDLWLFYQIGKELYGYFNRKSKGKRRKLR